METENYSFEFIGEGNTNKVAVCCRGVALSHFHIGVKFIGKNVIHPCRDCQLIKRLAIHYKRMNTRQLIYVTRNLSCVIENFANLAC